jgi:hypothetical protein
MQSCWSTLTKVGLYLPPINKQLLTIYPSTPSTQITMGFHMKTLKIKDSYLWVVGILIETHTVSRISHALGTWQLIFLWQNLNIVIFDIQTKSLTVIKFHVMGLPTVFPKWVSQVLHRLVIVRWAWWFFGSFLPVLLLSCHIATHLIIAISCTYCLTLLLPPGKK